MRFFSFLFVCFLISLLQVTFFFYFSVIASTWSTAWERATWQLKGYQEVGRRGWARSGACSGQERLLVTFEDEAASASDGAGQLAEFGQVISVLS